MPDDYRDFDDYQKTASTTAVYPFAGTKAGIAYCTLGLLDELGEISALIKREIRDGKTFSKAEITAEFGDLLWYLSEYCRCLGVSLGDVAHLNVAKLKRRKEEGTLHGKGDR